MRRIATLTAAVALCTTGVVGAASAHDEAADETTGTQVSGSTHVAMAQLRKALRPLQSPAAAQAAGYHPTDACVALPDGSAGMGYHYVNPTLLGQLDPTRPPILVFVPTKDGGRTLGAAEWFQADADQDLSTDGDRPSMFGLPFDGPMAGHEPGMPVHYDLHAWLFEANPDGLFSPWNPRVSC